MTAIPTAIVTDTQDVTISAQQLRMALERGDDVVILEVRSQGDIDTLREQYRQGHIPGAHFIHLGTHLAGPRTEGSGNNPLPSSEQLQQLVRDLGINATSTVVVYSPIRAPFATRAWWVLRWGGLQDVRYLDGGVPAWTAAGGELTSEVPQPRAGDAVVDVGALPWVDTDGVVGLAEGGLLLDARGASAYEGEPDENGGITGGHIPGARSRPNGLNLDEDGLLRSEQELREVYADAIDTDGEVVVYCGGGVGATLDILALTRIGVPATLYPGSFSAWSSDATRPVATGTEPGSID